jgi:creatinine amidohydrolase
MSLGGTITLDYATMAAVIGCTVKSVARHGFRRIFVLNGHGGNIAALETIITELTIETGLPLAGGTYWKIAAEPMRHILAQQQTVQHACEAETSMIQALYPDTVGSIDPSWNVPPGPGLGAIPGAHPGIYRWQRVETRSPLGFIGVPGAASPEKGEALLQAVSNEVARALADDVLWDTPS